ncbi:calcium ion binding protein [Aureococcus anophagefferens]|nr:calcium ion binding protein [Aureococcus anophagefferens]
MTVVVTACGAVDDADSCVASGEDVTFVFSPPKIYYVAIEAYDGSLLRPFAGCSCRGRDRSRHDDGSKNLECWDDSGEPTLFYRTYGECVECPANQALMIAMICAAALVGGGFFYLLKKRKVEIAVAAIGVDYLQVLSVFAGTEIRWPGALKDFYRSLAIFNLDFPTSSRRVASPCPTR